MSPWLDEIDEQTIEIHGRSMEEGDLLDRTCNNIWSLNLCDNDRRIYVHVIEEYVRCNRKMKMKRSRSLSPKPSSSDDKKHIKLEEDIKLNGITEGPHILEFSDDVLLNILKYLSPQDLMSLSLCCQRLCQVAQDRTLWRRIDFRETPVLLNDLRKYIKFLQPMTTSLAMRGNLRSEKYSGLTQKFFNTIKTLCTQLKELIMEEYHINGDKIQITDFPRTIEKFSLKGCEMGYLQSNRSYFYKMHHHMPNLTCLILSNCQWFTPHSLLVISKMPKLKELRLNSCHRLGECVAYASLATRFGFKTLEILDLRDTALGDSEVGCFSSTKTLTHLYLECPSNLRNEETPESVEQRRQQQRQVLQQPVFEDGNLAQFIVEDGFPWQNYVFQRCLISDRAICALGSDTCDRRVINNSGQRLIVVEEDKRIFNNPHLKTLVVRNYPNVTNSSLVHLALNASSLEYLDVTGKEDVNAEKCIILNELASMEFDYEKVIMDYLPTIAYHDTELANSVYTESQIVRSFSAETLTSFKNRQFKQCFMTMVGIGAISLQELQWRVCQHFNIGILDECESRSGNHEMFHTLQVPNFRFSGADLRLRDDDEELGYVAVGFEGPSYKQMDDHLALTIAKQIIGSWDMTYGGANHNAPYLAHCAFNSDMCYEYKSFMLSWISTSIWGCYFVCDKLKLEDMIYMLQKEWRRLYTTITDKEVTRAVNQCITQELTTLSNSEAHFLALIDVLFKRGYHEPMNERLARYEKVTANRIREVADKYIYDRCPAVVAIGRIENLPDYNVIRRGMYSLRY
ncbi:hypothetical protein KM043_018690 [Ampulex compressa]|nr:hypothetical protein KM043_018690 [Ampulex compressa]